MLVQVNAVSHFHIRKEERESVDHLIDWLICFWLNKELLTVLGNVAVFRAENSDLLYR